MPIEQDLAWAAGLFEGEGHLTERPIGKQVYLQLGIEMTDRDVIERFVRILTEHGVRPEQRSSGPRLAAEIRPRKKRAAHHKQAWMWATTGHTAAVAFHLLRPQLGERRRAKGDEILAKHQTLSEHLQRTRTCVECGRQYEPQRYGHSERRRFCSSRCCDKNKARKPEYRARVRSRYRRSQLKQRSVPGQNELF